MTLTYVFHYHLRRCRLLEPARSSAESSSARGAACLRRCCGGFAGGGFTDFARCFSVPAAA